MSEQYEDMVLTGHHRPGQGTCRALENAASIAALPLTIETPVAPHFECKPKPTSSHGLKPLDDRIDNLELGKRWV